MPVSSAYQPALSADQPGTDPAADRLGYAPFAKRLAQSIARLPHAEGHVIALYGGWGFGKTTMLNYVKHYLTQMRINERPIIVSFNPWWFAGHEDLVRAFFSQLRASMEGRKEISSTLRRRLADFAEALSETPLPYSNWGKIAGRMLRPEPKNMETLKGEISTALQAQTHRILVMIDDIDRLTSEEIRQIFRAVKSVGDFPNVTYLMAFDKRVVVRSLGQIQGGSGDDYLEKIVQVPFELPLVDRLSIRTLFVEQIDAILADIDPKTFDQTYWANIFLESIDHLLETPRDVVRFTNALAVTFRAVAGEVNPVDFIAIESLRIFCPEVYDAVRNNRAFFTGARETTTRPQRDDLLDFHNKWLGRLREANPLLEEPIRHMAKRLFPKLQSVWGNTQFGPEWESKWRLNLRICSESIFPIYFSLAIPTGEISNAEMRNILGNAGSAEKFGHELLNLSKQIRPDGKTRASAFLIRLQDYTTAEIPTEEVKPIVEALLDIGDQLIEPEGPSSGLFDLGADIQSGRVIWQLLKRVEAPRRFEILTRAFERGRALSLTVKTFIVLGQQQGLYGETASPEREWFVTREQLPELERILIDRIRDAARDGSLLHAARLLLVLRFWAEKGGKEDARDWARAATEDDNKLAAFLERCLHSSSSITFGDVVGQKRDRLDPKWLEAYLDVDQVVGRVRKLSQSGSLRDRQLRAVNQFLKEHELRKKGGNPDDPFAQDETA